MAVLEQAGATPGVDYGIYDADQHYYEAEDAVSRHLDRAHRHLVRWIEMDGRRTLLVNNQLFTVVPNPTYDPVGAPGSLEVYFRAENHAGTELRDLIRMQPIQPEYQERDARLARMDEQGVHFTWLLPSMGLGLEELLRADPEGLYAVFRSYNEWLDDDWGFDRDGRIQTGPLLSLIDPLQAEAELDRVLAKGARFVTFRPAPVAVPGAHRSPGDPSHDRIWAKLAEAGVVVVVHAADSGYARYLVDWGESGRYSGHKRSTLTEVLSVHTERPVFDFMAALVCHGVFDRHPTLRVASIELGASWAHDLVRRFRSAYGKTPQLFQTDPVESFREHVWVAPFYEDNIPAARDLLGADRLLLGSDWPHPEGLAAPRSWLPDFAALTDAERRLVFRDNLSVLARR